MSLVGDSKFEGWYQAHPKARGQFVGGEKQLAREAYEAGMKEAQDSLRERIAKALIDQLHMLDYSGAEADALWHGKPLDTILFPPRIIESPKITYAWECNECGSQEYTMAFSEADVNQLGCGRCGSSEWHKEVAR